MNSDETFSKDCNELEKYSFWLDLFEGDQILIFCLSRTIFHSAVISMIPIGKKIKRQMGLGMSLMVRLMNSRTILSTLSLREKRLMKLKRVHPSHCWPCTLRDVTIDVNDDEKLKSLCFGSNKQTNSSSSISPSWLQETDQALPDISNWRFQSAQTSQPCMKDFRPNISSDKPTSPDKLAEFERRNFLEFFSTLYGITWSNLLYTTMNL